MRKRFLFLALFVFVAAMGTNLIFAQATSDLTGWKDWKWKDYRLAFKLPANFHIAEQSSKRLVANDKKDITITIEPYKKARIQAKDVANYGLNKRKPSLKNLQIISQEDISKETPGVESFGILGSGELRNKKAIFVIIGYIDPNSSNNVMLEAIFWDNGDAKNEELVKIIQTVATTLKFLPK